MGCAPGPGRGRRTRAHFKTHSASPGSFFWPRAASSCLGVPTSTPSVGLLARGQNSFAWLGPGFFEKGSGPNASQLTRLPLTST